MLSKIIDEDLIQKIDRIIQKCDSFVIIAHENPDGDAIGSSLGMANFLRTRGKENVTVMMPNNIPPSLMWMPGASEILIYNEQSQYCDELLKNAEVLLFLDMSALDRAGSIANAVKNLTAHYILIDHHLNPQLFTHLTISYPEFSSTSEIVFRYICRVGCFDILSHSCAVCLYTGMMTDTGNFSYNSNKPEIYLIINQLMTKGIDKDDIYRKVNSSYSVDRMRMMGYVLYKKMEILPEYQSAIISMTQRELNKFHAQTDDTGSFVNMPLTIANIVFSAFLREDGKIIRISLRSVGNFPVNKLAEKLFGGGGHANASGARYSGSLEEAVQIIKGALPAFYQEYMVE